MTGDYTRFTHHPDRRYAGVLMQQGRVTLDADWNEQTAITARQLRIQALDTFGPAAVAWLNTPDAFLNAPLAGPPADFSIGPGRVSLEGLLAEVRKRVGWGQEVSVACNPGGHQNKKKK